MYSVLLIDDEAIIRRGLRNIVDWGKFNCVISGEAIDGQDGIEKIKEIKPDIIITDIRMPEIDGLDMIKVTKDFIPNCKIIILTGYRDFEYIQRAIKLGAFDYILKPSKIEDINSVVNRAVEELNEEKRKREEIKKLKDKLEEKVPILRQKLLYDLINGVNNDEESINNQLLSLDFNIKKFIIILVERDFQYKDKVEIYKYGIVSTFMDIFCNDFYIDEIPLSRENIAFLLQPIKETEGFMQEVVERTHAVQEIINKFFDFTVSISLSEEGSGPFQIYEKMNGAKAALEGKNKNSNNILLCQEHTKKNSEVQNNKENIEVQEKDISLVIKKAIKYIGENYNKPISLNDLAAHTYISTYYLCRLFRKELGMNFTDYLNKVRIEKAKEYLKDSNFKTYEVAELVGINDAHYFSKLFKKCTGVTPSEYR